MIQPEQQAYNRAYKYIHESESHFDFQSSNAIIEKFSKMFPQFHGMYLNLVDAYSDRIQEIFPPVKEIKKIA
jgi:hypothetical protein